MAKKLKDLQLSPKDVDALREAVQAQFDAAIYAKLAEIIKRFKSVDFKPELQNSKTVYKNGISDLVKAIVDGKIQFQNGRFEGEFEAGLSKELKAIGATWDRRAKAWNISEDKLPMDIRLAVGTMQSAYQNLHKEVQDNLDVNTALEGIQKERLKPVFEQTLGKYEEQFKKATQAVSVPVKFSGEMRENVTEQFSTNMEKFIKGWTEENILKLRQEVEQNMQQGGRAKNLEKILRQNYGASQNKAKFLAKQESGLLLSAYRKERYRDAGVQRYRWRTSNDERVRDRHRELNGQVFAWDEAIIDDKGTKGNPKEDFGCRCTAEPILEE